MDAALQRQDRHEESLKNHETRLGSLERFRSKALGIVLGLGTGSGSLAALIVQTFGGS